PRRAEVRRIRDRRPRHAPGATEDVRAIEPITPTFSSPSRLVDRLYSPTPCQRRERPNPLMITATGRPRPAARSLRKDYFHRPRDLLTDAGPSRGDLHILRRAQGHRRAR